MAIRVFYDFWLRIAAVACSLLLVLQTLAEVGAIYFIRGKTMDGCINCHVRYVLMPKASSCTRTSRIRTSAVGFSSEIKTSVSRFLWSVLPLQEVQIWGMMQLPPQRHLGLYDRPQDVPHGLYLLMDAGHFKSSVVPAGTGISGTPGSLK